MRAAGELPAARTGTEAVFGPLQAWAEYPVYAAHRIVEDSTMDRRRFRHPAPSDALAAFRWLGWVMLMMFVLVQTAHAAGSDTTTHTQQWLAPTFIAGVVAR